MPKMSRMERVMQVYLARDRSHKPGDAADHSLTQMQVAVLCGSHGLPVVPSHGLKNGLCTCGNRQCKHPGRHPRTTNGLRDANSDLTCIREFWSQWPKAKIIIATGAPDVIAVEAIGRKAEQKLNALIKEGDASENEPSPGTIKFRGRRTVTYLLRGSSDAIPNGRVQLAEGVFVHGSGSFIVVPRNTTRPGRSKQLYNQEIGDAPRWLLRLLGAPLQSESPVPQGERSDTMPKRDDKRSVKRPTIVKRTFDERLDFDLQLVRLNWIVLPEDSPRCDDKEVKALAESYKITGVRAPLVVRRVAGPTKDRDHSIFSLVSYPPCLEALKSLGIHTAECYVIYGDDDAELLWKFAEYIHQPKVKVLDWAHFVMGWVQIVSEKGVHLAHPRGGRQPHGKGLSAAARVLGVSRRELGRAQKIASICLEAQEVIRQARLHDIQRALLEIADTPREQQVEKALELKERYSKPRGSRRPRVPDAGPKKGCPPETKSPNLAPGDDESDQGTEAGSAERNDAISSVEVVNQPSDLGDCARDDEKLDMLRSLWNEHIATEWKKASEKVRLQFFRTLGYAAVANTSGLDLRPPAALGGEAQSHSNPAKTSTATRNDLSAPKTRIFKGGKPQWFKPLKVGQIGVGVRYATIRKAPK